MIGVSMAAVPLAVPHRDRGRPAADEVRRHQRPIEGDIDLQSTRDGFDDPFRVEEVGRSVSGAPVPGDAAASQRRGDSPGLTRAGHIRSELEKPHIGAFVVPIVRD